MFLSTYGALVMSSLSLSTEGGQSWAPWFWGLEESVPSLHLLWAGRVRTRSMYAETTVPTRS
jgi:hypothetical protein